MKQDGTVIKRSWNTFLQAPSTHQLPRSSKTVEIDETPPPPSYHRYSIVIDIPPKFNAQVKDEKGFYFFLAVYLMLLKRWSNESHQVLVMSSPHLHSDSSGLVTPMFWNIDGCEHLNDVLQHLRQGLEVENVDDLNVHLLTFIDQLKKVANKNKVENGNQELQKFANSSEEETLIPDFSLGYSFDCTLPVYPKKTYDLTLEVNPLGRTKQASSRFSIVWRYSSDAFNPESIEEFSKNYERLLRQVLDQPKRNFLKLPMISESCFQHQCEVLNQTSCLFEGADLSLHQLFEQQVSLTTDRVALVHKDSEITYQQLNHLANAIAHQLVQAGITTEQTVGVCMHRGVSLIASILGILKAGGVYVPLEPNYPAERLLDIFEQAEISLLLVDSVVQRLLNASEVLERFAQPIKLIEVQENWQGLLSDHVQKENLNQPHHPHHLAYVMFTSGSTGKPKGVAMEHRSVVNTLLDMNHRCYMDEEDVVLALSNISFDLSVFDVFAPLISGAKVVLLDSSSEKDPLYWLDQIELHRVTIWNSVPAAMRLLLEAFNYSNKFSEVFKKLKLCLLSGDWIPPELPASIWSVVPGLRIYGLGGATEASIWSIIYPVEQDTSAWSSIPYGKPLSNQRIFILNDYLQLCPLGVIGEIAIGGVGLARGYFRDEEKTQSQFVWCEALQARVYLTGDLGAYLPNGDVQFLGRADRQQKINGHRIEFEDILVHLRHHPGVKDAQILIIDQQHYKHLVAYVIPEHSYFSLEPVGEGEISGGENRDSQNRNGLNTKNSEHQKNDKLVRQTTSVQNTLKSYLKEHLPAYMIPNHVLSISAFPLTRNQKVDIKALQTLFWQDVESIERLPIYPAENNLFVEEARHHLPLELLNPIEQELLGLWQKLLSNSSRIRSVMDDFFQLGGDSILAIRLLFKINQTYSITIALRDLLETSTLQGMARCIDAHLVNADDPDDIDRTENERAAGEYKNDVDGVLTSHQNEWVLSTPAQQQMHYLDSLGNMGSSYHVVTAYQFNGSFDLNAFQNACELLVRRHQSLRCAFRFQQGVSYFSIKPPYQVNLPLIREDKTPSMLIRLAYSTPFDLSSGQLMRVFYARNTMGQFNIVLSFHHIALDGWSLGLLMTELAEEYLQRIDIQRIDIQGIDLQGINVQRPNAQRTETNSDSLNDKHSVAHTVDSSLFLQYVSQQHQWFLGADSSQPPKFQRWFKQSLTYWKKNLEQCCEQHSLPRKTGFLSEQENNDAAHVEYLFDSQLSQGIIELSRRYRVSLFVLLEAAFSLLLCRWSQNKDVVIATPMANRSDEKYESLIAMMMNTVLLRHHPIKNIDFVNYLLQVRDLVLEAHQYQSLPFDRVVEVINPIRQTLKNPVSQVLFALQQMDDMVLKLPNQHAKVLKTRNPTAKFDLSLEIRPIVEKENAEKDDAEKEGTEGLTSERSYQSFELLWEYKKSVFDTCLIERMAQQYEVMLRHLIQYPETPIFDIPILTEHEKSLLKSWNDTEKSLPSSLNIHQKFEQQAEKSPCSVAIRYGNTQYSYGEVNILSNQLAHYLCSQRRSWQRLNALHPGPLETTASSSQEVFVGIYLPRCPWMSIALLGTLKAGCAYVPLDIDAPIERLQTVIKDACLNVIISLVETKEQLEIRCQQQKMTLSGLRVSWVCVNDENQLQRIKQQPWTKLNLSYYPNDLAYIMYTSGSTGKPKGVMIEHHSVMNRLQWMQSQYPLASDIKNPSNVLQKTPFYFDVSVWEIFWPLLEGATSVLFESDDVHKRPQNILNTLIHQKISCLHFVPSMFGEFLDVVELALSNQDIQLSQLKSLKHIFFSGEVLPVFLVNRCQRLMPSVRLHNLYGPTEACVDVSAFECTHWMVNQNPPIGRPIDNIQFYVLDEKNKPVPLGVEGELYIAGLGVARGYWNQPSLTHHLFIDVDRAENTHRLEHHEHWVPALEQKSWRRRCLYRTGDRVRWRETGELEFLGRKDQQVKYHGVRIELMEIEHHIRACDWVKDAVVVHKTNPEHLVAFVVSSHQGEKFNPRSEQTSKWEDYIRRELLIHLPVVMMPKYIHFLEKLPVTSNGKLDRLALNHLGAIRKPLVYKKVIPETILQEKIHDIWARSLGRLDHDKEHEFGITDHFFELGGDSIIALQVVTMMNQLGFHCRVQDVFDYPTIAQLAARCEHLKEEDRENHLSQYLPLRVPLSPIQNKFLKFSLSQQAGIPHYLLQSMMFLCPSSLGREYFRPLIKALYLRHRNFWFQLSEASGSFNEGDDFEGHAFEGHYMTFPNTTDKWNQLLDQTIETISFTKDENGFQRLEEALTNIKSCIRLNQGPLWRAVFCLPQSSSEQESPWLFLCFHHFIIDVVSWKVIQEDLMSVFDLLLAETHDCFAIGGDEVSLLEVQMDGKWAEWGEFLGHYAKSQSLLDEKDFWLNLLSQPVKPLLPSLDEKVSSNNFGNFNRVNHLFSAELTQKLIKQTYSVYRTRVPELLLAALWLASQDHMPIDASSVQPHRLRIDVEGHGREVLEISGDMARISPDVNRVMGWFTSIYPIVIGSDVGEDFCNTENGEDKENQVYSVLSDVIKTIKEQYRQVPNGGIGFGLLNHLVKDAAIVAAEDDCNVPRCLFNYLGQWSSSQIASTVKKNGPAVSYTMEEEQENYFQFVHLSHGSDIGDNIPWPYPLMINVWATVEGLHWQVDYNTSVFGAPDVQQWLMRIMHHLESIIQHCVDLAENHQVVLTPSDFPLVDVSEEQLDVWLHRYPSMIKLYPCTPMQQGILYHGLLDKSAYITQLHLELENMDLGVWRQAWEWGIAKWDVFRTCFISEELDILQCVQSSAPVIWEEVDWTNLNEKQFDIAFQRFLRTDRQRGIDVSLAPLMRFSTFHLSNQRVVWVWTHHHAILDGWSVAFILRAIKQRYLHLLRDYSPNLEYDWSVAPKIVQFDQYVDWLLSRKQENLKDKKETKGFWEKQAMNLQQQDFLRLPIPDISDDQGVYEKKDLQEKQTISFSELESLRLVEFSKRLGLTLNSLLQGAWAMSLMTSQQHPEMAKRSVLFGMTISGRDERLLNSDKTVGLLIKTIPCCISLKGVEHLETWLQSVQQQSRLCQYHSHLPLTELQKVFDVPKGQDIFDTVMVMENYPYHDLKEAFPELRHIEAYEKPHYPLTLTIDYSTVLSIEFMFSGNSSYRRTMMTLKEILKNTLLDWSQRDG